MMKKLLLPLRSDLKLVLLAGLVFASACSPKLILRDTDHELFPVTNELPQDENILSYLQPYKSDVDSQMNEVIAVSAYEIAKAKPEGPLNNLAADAMTQAAVEHGIPVDLTITNYGGLRVPLPGGEIRLYNVFELMPFENLMVTVNLEGSDLMDIFEYMALNGGDPIAGARFTIRDKKPVNILVGGKPIDPEKTYTVLTSDYMANGGDNAAFFLKSTGRKEYPIKLRDAIISHLKKLSAGGRIINPKLDGRITIE